MIPFHFIAHLLQMFQLLLLQNHFRFQNLIHVPSKVAPLLRMMDNTEVIAEMIGDEIRKALEAVAETPLPTYAAAEDDSDEDSEEAEDEEV